MPSVKSFLWNFKRLGPLSWTRCTITNAMLYCAESWARWRIRADVVQPTSISDPPKSHDFTLRPETPAVKREQSDPRRGLGLSDHD